LLPDRQHSNASTLPRQSDPGTRRESSGERNLKGKEKGRSRSLLVFFFSDVFPCRVTALYLSYIFGIPKNLFPALCSPNTSYLVDIKSHQRTVRATKLPFIVFAVLFIECLTFLPTFVNIIIFMYYVINKGGTAIARWSQSQLARTRA
jgi:hypothetical protein